MKKQTKIDVDANIEDEIKRALFYNDDELLEEILQEHPELSRYRIDKERNVQLIHKACQSDNPKIIELLV